VSLVKEYLEQSNLPAGFEENIGRMRFAKE
jgi:hypothetical protein